MIDQLEDEIELRLQGPDCVPGGFIYTPNLEEHIRRLERGVWYYEEYWQMVLFEDR